MKRPTTIMITNQKGGVGKTTTSLELAHLLGADGYKVLCIDTDPQGDLTTYLDIESPKYTLKEILDAEILLDEAVIPANTFYVIAGNQKLSQADKLYGASDDIFLLKDALEDADYDFVILDSPPGKSQLLIMEYVAADYIIAPAECDDGSIKGLIRIKEDLDRLKKRNFTNARVLGTFITKYEKTGMHETAYEQMSESAEDIGGPRFDTKIRKSVRASEAKSARVSITEYERFNNVSLDYKHLKDEILSKLNS